MSTEKVIGKITYTLTIDKDESWSYRKLRDGSLQIEVIRDCVDPDLLRKGDIGDEYRGDAQSDMLFEIFDHDFKVEKV